MWDDPKKDSARCGGARWTESLETRGGVSILPETAHGQALQMTTKVGLIN